jgi:hypothetical protein
MSKKRSALVNSNELSFLSRTDLELTDIKREEYMKRLNAMVMEKQMRKQKQIEDDIIAKGG